MKAHIERDPLIDLVKVWMYNDVPEGRIFMWPVDDHGSWKQEIVGQAMAMPDTVRPMLEMTGQMWKHFTEALLGDHHLRVDALDIVAKTLEREQTRVDVLLDNVLKLLKVGTYSLAPHTLIMEEPKHG